MIITAAWTMRSSTFDKWMGPGQGSRVATANDNGHGKGGGVATDNDR